MTTQLNLENLTDAELTVLIDTATKKLKDKGVDVLEQSEIEPKERILLVDSWSDEISTVSIDEPGESVKVLLKG